MRPLPAFQKVLREMDVMRQTRKRRIRRDAAGQHASPKYSHVVKRMRAAAANCVLPLVDRELQIRFRHGIAELKAERNGPRVAGPRAARGDADRRTAAYSRVDANA